MDAVERDLRLAEAKVARDIAADRARLYASTVALQVGRVFGVPMDLIDGRPWVPTELESNAGDADPWGSGSRGRPKLQPSN